MVRISINLIFSCYIENLPLFDYRFLANISINPLQPKLTKNIKYRKMHSAYIIEEKSFNFNREFNLTLKVYTKKLLKIRALD